MLVGEKTVFILVCIFAIFWQYKQPKLPISFYSQLAWQQRSNTDDKAGPSSKVSPAIPTIEQPLLGVTVVITGATNGLGLGLAKTLHRMGATIVAVGRSSAKLLSVKNGLDVSSNNRVHTFMADFSDLVSVSKAADEIKAKFDSIDFLINNAGMYHAATVQRATVQGYDMVFGVNYLSHVLWTHKLLPLVQKSTNMKSGGARVIQITSTMHVAVNGDDLISQPPLASLPLNSTSHKERSYSNSKLAQIYHARALNRLMFKKPNCQVSNPPASCVRIVNVCPSWVGTSISASNSAEFIMTHLGYEADGFGTASTLYAMFHPNASISLDYVSNNRKFTSFVRPASQLAGSYMMDLSNMRLTSSFALSFVLLLIEKFIPDTGFVDSSEESYNESRQDALYAWSLKAITPFL